MEKLKRKFADIMNQLAYKIQLKEIEWKCQEKGLEKVTYPDRPGDWCYKFTDKENIYKVYFDAFSPRVEFIKDLGEVDEDTGVKFHNIVGALYDNWFIDINNETELLDSLKHFALDEIIEMVHEQQKHQKVG